MRQRTKVSCSCPDTMENGILIFVKQQILCEANDFQNHFIISTISFSILHQSFLEPWGENASNTKIVRQIECSLIPKSHIAIVRMVTNAETMASVSMSCARDTKICISWGSAMSLCRECLLLLNSHCHYQWHFHSLFTLTGLFWVTSNAFWNLVNAIEIYLNE